MIYFIFEVHKKNIIIFKAIILIKQKIINKLNENIWQA
jgi:hypothetical protein